MVFKEYWVLYFDGASKKNQVERVWCYKVSTDSSLSFVGALRVKSLKVCGDSRLVVSQVNGEFEAKDETMARYLKLVKAIMTQFDECYLEQIPREENMKVDTLSKFASSEIENYAGSV
ncbi:hypothetical protein POM88_050057 [Heracleum sosnowskyi]|uniref:RNase H type-1 domain-containing protein n=1 Tax=Heracleum sosnowskyi TaxID=360622 RepID=A0AAD8GY26_9APIA|nr:hypothetical protein POM88_050055 [Heracleum sosnowskyi]KAK1356801.1 hypothetical protein POM88_050057 [Heracleum sosnowskyi]